MTRIFRIILLCEVMALACSASAQSIADLARQERDRKKAVANKTYTNADIGPASGTVPIGVPEVTSVTGVPTVTAAGTSAATTTAAGTVTATGAAAVKPTGPTDRKGHDEKYWREQFATAREELKSAEDQIRILESKTGIARNQMLGQSDLYNADGRFQAEIVETNKQIEANRQNANKARQKIAALEEELRRSGGPAGWAR
jgi:hypothetical protein